MILQALYDYYHRKAAQDSQSIAPLGFQYKEIPFLIVIDETGQFIQLEDTREGEGKKKRAKSFLVPQEVGRPGKHSWKTAFLLWDKLDYLLGISTDAAKADVALKSKQAFIEKIQTLPETLKNHTSIRAVLSFLHADYIPQITQDHLWPEVLKATGPVMTFRIRNKPQVVCEEPDVFSDLKVFCQPSATDMDLNAKGVCLITGTKTTLARLHPVIKAFEATGVSIVSFNENAYCSYGKKQSYNAPVGIEAANSYTAALNLLLGRDSRQKLFLGGDTTITFWAERQSDQADVLEDRFADLFADDKDNPDLAVDAVEVLYKRPWSGKQALESGNDRFFVLGLSPNKARLSIRFFHVLSLEGLSQNIRQHFEDLSICHSPREQAILPLRQLIRQLCLQGDLKNAPPNLEGAFFESIVVGAPYPLSVLQAVVRRIRAEQAGDHVPVNYARAALLKGFLNRWYRREKSGKEFTVSLDETNAGIGYCLGRLFALLERIQESASGISTVRERFYGSASSTPAVAFPQLLKLKNHHLAKMDAQGKVIYFERLLASVMGHIPDGFPTHLSLFEQGAFSVGYYHQRQALFEKKDKSEQTILTEESGELPV